MKNAENQGNARISGNKTGENGLKAARRAPQFSKRRSGETIGPKTGISTFGGLKSGMSPPHGCYILTKYEFADIMIQKSVSESRRSIDKEYRKTINENAANKYIKTE